LATVIQDTARGSNLGSAISNEFTQFETFHEIIKAAQSNVARNAWDYMVGAAESETTLKRNRRGFDCLALKPRVLRDVTKIDRTVKFLGHTLRIPVILAPIGSLQSLCPEEGSLAQARGAERFGTISILSSVTSPGIEETAKATKHPKIFQLYVRGDDEWVDDHAKKAIDLGYAAFCFTIDSSIYGRRERDIIKRYRPTARTALDTRAPVFQAGLSWKDIARFKKLYPSIPVVLKGIATAEDAKIAVEHGVEVVYVSNHGGRQLDHGRGSIEVLPEVVDAVRGKALIVMDGMVNRGTDVVKAMCLGADAVGIGRLYGYGLAAAGAAGVNRVLEIMENEITVVLANLGVTSFKELDASFVCKAEPVCEPHVFSAFPHLKINLGDY
jgi:glycolate oxidase